MKHALFAFLLVPSVDAQTPARVLDFNQHLWVSYSGDHPVSERWGVHFDAQWRRADLGSDWQQYQLRPGVVYALRPDLHVTAGYAYTRSYPYGDFPVQAAFPEHRIYQQLTKKHPFQSLRIQHRVRLEQRFVGNSNLEPRSWTYQNRFRYMLRAEVPLTSEDRWYLPISDEILIGIPPNLGARAFDQNRLYVGIGRSISGAKVEVGYMNQFLGQRNGRVFEFNNTLVFSVSSDVSLSALFGD
jgi:hypothetical protein